MRIRLEYDGNVFEYEHRPMRSSRFKALCYVAMVAAVAKFCGLPGVIVVGVVTILYTFLYALFTMM